MRILYITLLLFFTPSLFAQHIELAPFQGNPILRSHSVKEKIQQALIVERMTGTNPVYLQNNRNDDVCPPDIPPESNIVSSGSTLVLELDTFGLGQSGEPGFLNVVNLDDLQFGTAQIADSTILFRYEAIGGFDGIGMDTVLVEFDDDATTDTIQVIVTVVRADQVIIANPVTIDPEDIITYCLDDEVNFNSPRNCSHFTNCPDDYDGEGQQSFHFTSYQFPDTCIVYYASRFPGTDTVCVEICDDLGVCDVFKIPVIITGETLSVSPGAPIFEDFSSYQGPYPSNDLWLDKDVFVNSTFTENPPSVGFATFDGLDSGGKPYDIANGIGDRLTSKPIDLSAYDQDDDVVLRFFYSPKGFGSEPALGDEFTLEFRNVNRQWIVMETFQGMANVPLDSIPPFFFHAEEVNQNQFLHNAFQFRFSAKVSPGGYGDWWHLDYIHLSPVSVTSDVFEDMAFITVPTSPLKNYTALPLNHFLGHLDRELIDPAKDSIEVKLFNNFDSERSFTNSKANFREVTTAQNFSAEFDLQGGTNIKPDTFIVIRRDFPASDLSSLKAELDQIPLGPLRILETQFSYVPSEGESGIYVNNNNVTQRNIFSDYFAYDDGTAEQQLFIRFAKGGEDLVLKYHANVQDTLTAVQFMFPHYTEFDIANQLFNLNIWVDTNPAESDPVYTGEFLTPFFPDEVYDTLQGFTTYKLIDSYGEETPVILPADTDFYIGFEQITQASPDNNDTGIPIGYDVNNSLCADCFWGEFGDGQWIDSLSMFFTGALMMRPVVEAVPFNTNSAVKEDPVSGTIPVKVYPNPASNQLNIRLLSQKPYENYHVWIYNELGQLVLDQTLSEVLNVGALNPGTYFLQIRDEKSGNNYIEKIFIVQ